MDIVWLYTLGSVLVVSLVSFVGVLVLSFKEERLKKILIYLVSFSAGALLGGAFIHLLPEAAEETGFGLDSSLWVLAGIIVYFVLEKVIRFRHCHRLPSKEHPHPFSFMILLGDAVHNFIDGILIGASFLVNIKIGITTTLAVIFHEIPQEIGDFGSLLYGGFSKSGALLLNFISALTALGGAILILILGVHIKENIDFLLFFTAGGFIYIAIADLIPELQKKSGIKTSIGQFLFLAVGILIMLFLRHS